MNEKNEEKETMQTLVEELQMGVQALEDFCFILSSLKDPINLGRISGLVFLLTTNQRIIAGKIAATLV